MKVGYTNNSPIEAMPDRPPNEGRRERKKREMRENILSTATWLFSQHGYHETTVQEIADQLDISSATVFNYFGSKDQVVKELADEMITDFEALMERLMSAERETVSAVERYLGPAGTTFEPRREVSRGLSIEIFRVVMASPESRGSLERMEAMVADVIMKSQKLGEARTDMSARHQARVIMHMVLGTLTAWLVDPDISLQKRLMETVVFMRKSISATQQAMGSAKEYPASDR